MEGRRRVLLFISSLCIFAAIAAFLNRPYTWRHHDLINGSRAKPNFAAPKRNVFSELTDTEANEVYDFLSEELAYLNLTKAPNSARDNFVFIVETLRPNKTDAISYLYEDGEKPERWAKAAVSQNLDGEPVMVYCKCSRDASIM